MIKSFADKKTKAMHSGEAVQGIAADVQKKALRRLRYLDAARVLNDLIVPPSNALKKLKGKLKDFYSIRVNKQWRIIFKWDDEKGGASEVEFTDYH